MTLFIYFKRLIPLKVLLVFLLCLATGFLLYAQQTTPEVRPLTIGDTVPDITVNKVLNYKSNEIKFSDFKGKAVILYFWEPFCSACISTLPKLDTLQNMFDKKIQMITVTKYGSRDQIIHLLSMHEQTKNIKLPVIINDPILFKYFKHAIVPHVIWISADGVVRNITSSEYINKYNISGFLSDNSLKLPRKKDVIDFDYRKPLLKIANKYLLPPPFLYYSSLCGHLSGVDATTTKTIDSANRYITLNFFNLNLVQLCRLSLENATAAINKKRLLLITDSPGNYIYKNTGYYDAWQSKHTYCYTLQIPLGTSEMKQKEMIKNDLQRWLVSVFSISMKIEKRLRPCLLLARTSHYQDNLLKSKGGIYKNTLGNIHDTIRILQNTGLSSLVWYLNESVPNIPWVIDNTGIPEDERVDLRLKIRSFHDIPALQNALAPYGLALIPGMRYLETYVLTDSSGKGSLDSGYSTSEF